GVNSTPTYKLVPGSRAVLIDDTGRRSQIRSVLSGGSIGLFIYNNGTERVIAWPPENPVPFIPAEVRIVIPQPRYTWLLTVRKKGISGGSVTDIDCVVFFNRPLGDPSQETVHAAIQPAPTNPNVPPPLDELEITFTPGTTPKVKRSDWVFDAQNA